MLEREDFLIPYFNDEYRFDKPPLTYWWMSLNFAAFGVNEFSARLHSTQATWLTALVIFFFALRLGLKRSTAFYAAAIWLTCLQTLIHSRMAVADMPLILFVTLACSTLHKAMSENKTTFTQVALLSLWLALAFLAKGPLAYAIPQLALLLTVLFIILGKKEGQTKSQLASFWSAQWTFLIALLPSLILVGLWAIPALIETGGAFFNVGIGTHVVERGTAAMNKRDFIPGIYLLWVFPFLLPWSALLPITIKRTNQTPTLDARFLLATFIAPFLIFSFYKSQLPHYILPGYPFFALLLALTWKKDVDLKLFGKTLTRLACWLPILAGILISAFALLLKTRPAYDPDFATLLTLLGGLLFALGLFGIVIRRTINPLALAPFVIIIFASLHFGGALARKAHLTIRLKELTGPIQPGRLEASHFAEESLVWYYDDFSKKEITGFLTKHPEIQDLDPESAALSIVTKRRWRIDEHSILPLLTLREVRPLKDNTELLTELFGAETVKNAPTVSGWSPGTMSWFEVLVLHQKPPSN